MFLATDWVGQIDDAIASRIYFKPKYNDLDPEQRTNIWKYFLGEAATSRGKLVYSPADFESLVQKKLNDREVR